jgi:hypothetical protein
MKPNDNHFETHVDSAIARPLHPKLKTLYSTAFPSGVDHLRNLIFYGPPGTGKYSQVLACISRYSPTHLKYEKRLTISFNKETYFIKISDIHFEIDMSLLGCNSKLLWNEMHNQIVDVISARADSVGIIVCKYFHNIHSELLETFYSYMHMPHQGGTNPIRLKYVLITEHIGFIPNNILNSCEVIPVARPTAAIYKKIIAPNVPMKIIPENVTNIKILQNPEINAHATTTTTTTADATTTTTADENKMTTSNQELFNNLCKYVADIPQIRYMKLRELLYDILIYDFDITECAWHLITDLKRKELLHDDNMSAVLINTCKFLQYYNNNYRPIYHLENFVFMLINIICENKNKSNQ